MRPRTFLRGAVLAVLLVVLGLLVAHTAISAWGRRKWAESSSRFEQQSGTLDLRSLELPGVPDERNAATWIAKGSAALLLKRGAKSSRTVLDLSSELPTDWNEEDISNLRGEIALNRGGLVVLANARDLDESTFGIPVRDGSTAKIPNLLQIVDASKLVFVRGSLALRDGDRLAAISDAALLGNMARVLQRERPLIVVIVGLGVERFQLRLVHAVIENPELTPDELRELLAGVLHNAARADYAQAVRAEAAVMCTELRPLAGDRGMGPQGWNQLGFRVSRAIAGDALAASCLDVYGETAASLDAPVLAIAERIEQAQNRLNEAWGSWLASMLTFPNLVNGSERAWLTLELRRLTRAAATLRERAWREGAYPADLTGLPLDATPDPEGTGAWTYEQRADGSARLEAPSALALAGRVLHQGQAKTAPFVWTLPPPSRSR